MMLPKGLNISSIRRWMLVQTHRWLLFGICACPVMIFDALLSSCLWQM